MELELEGFVLRSAVLSECGTYRYRLEREVGGFGNSGTLLWIMLNPSTADSVQDDPTIRKCIGFTKLLGFERLMVGNLFAFRATDPEDLRGAHQAGMDVVGPANDAQLDAMMSEAQGLVLAWGGHGTRYKQRVDRVYDLLRTHALLPTCELARTADGQPRHPLMLPYKLAADARKFLRRTA